MCESNVILIPGIPFKKQWMFNDTTAQKINWLLSVKQMVN